MSKMKGPVHGDYFPDVDGVPSLSIIATLVDHFAYVDGLLYRPPKGVTSYFMASQEQARLYLQSSHPPPPSLLSTISVNLSLKEHFRVADNLSPIIVFLDAIDAVGTKRIRNLDPALLQPGQIDMVDYFLSLLNGVAYLGDVLGASHLLRLGDHHDHLVILDVIEHNKN
ncbi:26S protease regulatory subunit 4-like protein [Cucumis melo var. makuwa]|uniref:26S protease regulatory subunit 4-like protein n=1 Tax=Cucumis melo var. makuwa TaxID=1194695 RepID=A0A5D3BFW9_CUCMM|nr:26S protease regulatory subunit 4-like protein [Cucumis melo var. makuwa]TYJ98017.1 26S protease regulatory subunit 4-like protein [Cucumis melo var. makuwa]